MKNEKWGRKIAIIVVCVLLDIVLHLMTSVYSTMPENPSYSILAKLLGSEITALLWALLSFSGAAYVYCRIKNELPGEGVEKGIRYGFAIALLWLFGMIEGVALFGNPIINELVVGLSDAIPVFLMGILLGMQKSERGENATVEPLTRGQKMKALSVFTGIFLIGRYLAYITGFIQSGHQTSPVSTFFWTLLMGACIGVVCILIGTTRNIRLVKRNSIIFGFLIFGTNWAAFLAFMPLLFSGYFIDVLFRIILDTLLVTIGYYLTFNTDIFLKPRLIKCRSVFQREIERNKHISGFIACILLLLSQIFFGKMGHLLADMVSYQQIDPYDIFARISIHHAVQMIIALIFIVALSKQLKLDFYFQLGDAREGARYLALFIAAFAVISIASHILMLLKDQLPAYTFPLDRRNMFGTLGFQLLLSGPSEEIVFRAIPITILIYAFGKSIPIKGKITLEVVLASLLFSFAHTNWSLSPLSFEADNFALFYSFVLGTIQGIAYQRTKSILYPILMHSFSNVLMAGTGYLFSWIQVPSATAGGWLKNT